ncbi:MAG: hypothetical protein ABIP57_11460 [Jatrophihabitantaceae bacterium]
MSDQKDVRIGEDADGARLWVRSGAHAAREIAIAMAFGSVIVALCAFSGRILLTLAIIVALYFTVSATLAYFRCGVWIYETEVQVRAALVTNRAGLDDVSGIGVLRSSRFALFGVEQRQLALLLKSGQWYFATGVSGRPSVIEVAASRVSELTGWPVATSAIRSEAKADLLRR